LDTPPPDILCKVFSRFGLGVDLSVSSGALLR
jgi:hypothetical protein